MSSSPSDDRRADRERMVHQQLEERGIEDERVLEAFRSVPRHEFVNPPYRDQAYGDRALPTEHGQTISQPYMVASMTEYLRVESGNTVLEIGTGSGYQTAILLELGARVFTVERNGELSARARVRLSRLGYDDRVAFRVGDGTEGWPEHAPYDRVLVTAGAPSVPEPLKKQAGPDARIVIPVGSKARQELVVLSREGGGEWSEDRTTGCVFVPLTGSEGWEDSDRDG